jgi:hypothetical protein
LSALRSGHDRLIFGFPATLVLLILFAFLHHGGFLAEWVDQRILWEILYR